MSSFTAQGNELHVPAGVSRDWLTDHLLMVWQTVRKTQRKREKKEEEEEEERKRRRRGVGRRYLPNDIIAAESVLVHDGDNYGGLPQHVGRHVKGEGLVENRVQTALHYHRLLLLHTLVLVHQPHFYVGVWEEGNVPVMKQYSIHELPELGI